MYFNQVRFAANAQMQGNPDVNLLKNQGFREHLMVSKALKTLAAVAVALTSTAALATLSAAATAELRPAQAVPQVAPMQASGTRNTSEITAFNDVTAAFGTRARSTDRVQSAATGLPELDNWMLLAAGAVLILMVTQRRMRNVND